MLSFHYRIVHVCEPCQVARACWPVVLTGACGRGVRCDGAGLERYPQLVGHVVGDVVVCILGAYVQGRFGC